jgi:phosphoglycolate phosphatase-like HAD superfamily hydrolase
VLFDIDGTLCTAGGISSRALAAALVRVFGTEGAAATYDYGGKTDHQIVRELMGAAGFSDDEIDRRRHEAVALYREILHERLRPEHVVPLPGIHPLLEALEADPRVTLGLLTGNVEPNARLKLEPLGVNRYFPFGAFGCDHEDRRRLPEVALARASAHAGARFEGKDAVIVGDSVHDVRCGRHLGVRTVAVATGRTAPEVLAAERPVALLADLSDTAAARAAILGPALP